jgi:hypothetical protein
MSSIEDERSRGAMRIAEFRRCINVKTAHDYD